MKAKARKQTLLVMLILSLIGLATAIYQSIEHYFLESSICDFTEGFSCSAVTGSRFGEWPQFSGISVSLWGILFFLTLLWLLFGSYRNKEKFKLQEFYSFALLGSGFLGVLYFLWVELIALPAEIGELIICPLCTVQHIAIAILLVLGFLTLKKPLRQYIKETFMEEDK